MRHPASTPRQVGRFGRPASRRLGFGLLLAAGLLAGVQAASACGDKILDLARGVRFQRAGNLQVASILVFAGADAKRDPAARLESTLSKIGHKVWVVDSQTEFDAALASRDYDLVISALADAQGLAPKIAAAPSRPLFVPIADESEAARLRQGSAYPYVVASSERSKEQVRTIDDAIRSRGAAQR